MNVVVVISSKYREFQATQDGPTLSPIENDLALEPGKSNAKIFWCELEKKIFQIRKLAHVGIIPKSSELSLVAACL